LPPSETKKNLEHAAELASKLLAVIEGFGPDEQLTLPGLRMPQGLRSRAQQWQIPEETNFRVRNCRISNLKNMDPFGLMLVFFLRRYPSL
jgi:hypothetical protein